MDDFDKTVRFQAEQIAGEALLVTVFDASSTPRVISLSSFNKKVITFGREEGNDIVLLSFMEAR